jgi:hypothetical protein
MEKKSYSEILHNICIEFGHGEKSRVETFEKAIMSLIDQIVTDEKKKLLPNENFPKNEHYLRNDDIKNDCDSCSRHDIIVGCTLKHKNKCMVDGKHTKYRRVHLLPCDKCKTYSVVTKIDRIADNNKNSTPRPAIKFICLKCKDYPTINKGIFKGYELRGMEFTEKYLRMCKQRAEQEQCLQKAEQDQGLQKADQEQGLQKAKPAEEHEETAKSIEKTVETVTGERSDQMAVQNQTPLELSQNTQQTDPEIEIVAISG